AIESRLTERDAAVAQASRSLVASTTLAIALLAVAWLLHHREVAARQRAAESQAAARVAVEEAARAKDRMLAGVGHELRTPLSPILMQVTALRRRVDDPGLRQSLEVIRRHIELETRLIDDLIDLALMEQGRLRLDRSTVDVHEAIHRAVEICRGAAAASDR